MCFLDSAKITRKVDSKVERDTTDSKDDQLMSSSIT